MKKNIKNILTSANEKQVWQGRVFIFFAMLVLLLIRTFERGSVVSYTEKLSWILNFNYITDSSFTRLLNSTAIKPFIILIYIAFLFLTATVLEKFYHALPMEKAWGKESLVTGLTVSPVLFIYYCKPTVYDRACVIVFTIMLIRLLFLQKSPLNIISPLLTALCILIHHNSFFTVYPAVFIISFMLISKEKKEKIILGIDAAVAVATIVISGDFNYYGKDQSFFYNLIILLIVSLPILICILHIFIGAFSNSKNKKYLVFLFVPILFSTVAFFTTSFVGAVFSQTITSLVLIIVFAVINKEKHIIKMINSVVEFCNKKPIFIMVIIAFEASLLRADHEYFGFIGSKIANYFCF